MNHNTEPWRANIGVLSVSRWWLSFDSDLCVASDGYRWEEGDLHEVEATEQDDPDQRAQLAKRTVKVFNDGDAIPKHAGTTARQILSDFLDLARCMEPGEVVSFANRYGPLVTESEPYSLWVEAGVAIRDLTAFADAGLLEDAAAMEFLSNRPIGGFGQSVMEMALRRLSWEALVAPSQKNAGQGRVSIEIHPAPCSVDQFVEASLAEAFGTTADGGTRIVAILDERGPRYRFFGGTIVGFAAAIRRATLKVVPYLGQDWGNAIQMLPDHFDNALAHMLPPLVYWGFDPAVALRGTNPILFPRLEPTCLFGWLLIAVLQRIAPMADSVRRCQHCGKPLASGSRADAKYCPTGCRTAAKRDRDRQLKPSS